MGAEPDELAPFHGKRQIAVLPCLAPGHPGGALKPDVLPHLAAGWKERDPDCRSPLPIEKVPAGGFLKGPFRRAHPQHRPKSLDPFRHAAALDARNDRTGAEPFRPRLGTLVDANDDRLALDPTGADVRREARQIDAVIVRIRVEILQLAHQIQEHPIEVIVAGRGLDAKMIAMLDLLPIDLFQLEEGIVPVDRLPENVEVLHLLGLRQALLESRQSVVRHFLAGHKTFADPLDNPPICLSARLRP